MEALNKREHNVSGRSSETSTGFILKLLRRTSVTELCGSFALGCLNYRLSLCLSFNLLVWCLLFFLLAVNDGLCGSYSCGSVAGSTSHLKSASERSPARESPFKPQGSFHSRSSHSPCQNVENPKPPFVFSQFLLNRLTSRVLAGLKLGPTVQQQEVHPLNGPASKTLSESPSCMPARTRVRPAPAPRVQPDDTRTASSAD